MSKAFALAVSHMLVAAAGFAAGIYALPILTAPDAPSTTEMAAALDQAEFTGVFTRDLDGSDLLHWGEGTVSIGRQFISLHGRIAPGPDYRLYLSPAFVETEGEFSRLKADMVSIGDVRTFENFVVPVPGSVDPGAYNTVIVWCESFGEFITAAKYQ
jgi:hypothetical protein